MLSHAKWPLWLLLFFFHSFLSAQTYYAVQNGQWADADNPIWSDTPGGPATLNAPNDPAVEVVIPSGITVELNISAQEVASLTVAAGGTLTRSGGIRYLAPHGDLIVDGVISGNVGLAPRSGTIRVYSTGNGSATFGRIRKDAGGAATLAIEMDVTVAYAGSSAAIFNAAGSTTAFGNLDIVIAAGRTLTVTAGDVSLDGVDGTNSSEYTGKLQIFGTLDIQDGDLWLTSDNDAGNDLAYSVESGGRLQLNGALIGNDVAGMPGSAGAQVSFSLAAGGELRLLGPGGGWRDLSARNTVELASGGRITYAGSGSQTVFPDWAYPELAVANSETRLVATTATEDLTFEPGGRLSLGDFDLEIAGSLSGDADGFVVTDGAGQLRIGMESLTTTTFPLGSNVAEYLPLTIERTGNGLRTDPAAAPKSGTALLALSVGSFNPAGLQPAASIVARRWSVVLTAGDGTGFSITPGWAAFQQQSNFTPANCYISWRQDADPWTGDPPGPAAGPVAGYYSRTRGPVTFTTGVINEFVPASNGALPVTLSDFSAQAAARSVLLSWTTSGEIDNDYFAIERSADGRDFQPIGRVAGVGQSAVVTKYAFTDERPLSGRSYYRLRQVDFDGTAEYFGPVAVDFAGSGKAPLFVYPNPVAADFVTLEGSLDKGSELHLLDATGRVLRAWSPAERELRRELPLAGLPAGVYLLRLTEGERVRTVRLVRE